MPFIVPALAYIGAAEGASAASAAAAGAATVSAATAAATTAISLEASSKAASAAAQAADYNAKLDAANAAQLSMDATANIQKQRQDDAAYQSNQRAAFAASGILSDTGSPMQVEATTAGREEQNIQTYWTSVQEKESQLYSSAAEGVYEGQEEADVYHLQGVGDIFSGVGSIAGTFGRLAQPTADIPPVSGDYTEND
jgi:hypothetical protein